MSDYWQDTQTYWIARDDLFLPNLRTLYPAGCWCAEWKDNRGNRVTEYDICRHHAVERMAVRKDEIKHKLGVK